MKNLMMMVMVMVVMATVSMTALAATEEPKVEEKKGFFTSIGEKADAAVGFVNKTVVKPAAGVVKGAGKGIAHGASVAGKAVKNGTATAIKTVGKTIYDVGDKLGK